MLRNLKQLILTAPFVLFAAQASTMLIQPDWLDPTQPGVGTKRYSYSFNDPINNMDPNGNACTGQASGHCDRSERYEELSEDEKLTQETSFMHAAANVTWALGDVDRAEITQRLFSGSRVVATPEVRAFLESVGAELFRENMAVVEGIRNGETVLGLDPSQVDVQTLDEAWVRFEQGLVQDRLDSLKSPDIGAYSQVVTFSNRSIKALENNRAARTSNPAQRDAAAAVRSQLGGQSWNFENLNHRIMMGDAATRLMRERLGLQ